MSWFALEACTLESLKNPPDVSEEQIILPSGQIIQIRLAVSSEEKIQGLSGIPDDKFADDEGMLFVYEQDDYKLFWMPDTYFDLDIFFLDENMKVLDVERNVPHHPGREEPPAIARTRSIFSRHVLEMRADSELAKNIDVGDQLKWSENDLLEELIN